MVLDVLQVVVVVVELLLVEDLLQLPVDVEVWVQVLVVEEEVVRVLLLPEHGPVASHEPQVAPVLDPHKKGSISGQGARVVRMKSKVLMMLMGLKPV